MRKNEKAAHERTPEMWKRLEPAAGEGVTREADGCSSGGEASMKTLARKQDNDISHTLCRDGWHELAYLSTANKNNWDCQQEGRRNDDIDWPLRTSALGRKGEKTLLTEENVHAVSWSATGWSQPTVLRGHLTCQMNCIVMWLFPNNFTTL